MVSAAESRFFCFYGFKANSAISILLIFLEKTDAGHLLLKKECASRRMFCLA